MTNERAWREPALAPIFRARGLSGWTHCNKSLLNWNYGSREPGSTAALHLTRRVKGG